MMETTVPGKEGGREGGVVRGVREKMFLGSREIWYSF